ncbi:MAG: hypothetical protein PHS59_06820 [Paludibacter sp.]|nr:hypothetical protein [Paludibacter sp.]
MAQSTPFLQKIKPRISKKCLLFVAAIMWTFAGGMLMFRGVHYLIQQHENFRIQLIVSLFAGLIFYLIVFSKVSLKHSLRIIHLPIERPCFFSFFSWSSYALMFIMIGSGIAIRLSGIVPVNYLSEFYITMGLPLFLSAIRFYYFGFNYQSNR